MSLNPMSPDLDPPEVGDRINVIRWGPTAACFPAGVRGTVTGVVGMCADVYFDDGHRRDVCLDEDVWLPVAADPPTKKSTWPTSSLPHDLDSWSEYRSPDEFLLDIVPEVYEAAREADPGATRKEYLTKVIERLQKLKEEEE